MAGNEILIWSREDSLSTFVRELIGDLDIKLVPFRTIEDLPKIKAATQVTSAVIDCPPKEEDFVRNMIMAIWTHFPKLPIAPVFTDSFVPQNLRTMPGFKHLEFLQRPFEIDSLFDWLLQSLSIEIPGRSMTLKHLSPIRIADLVPNEPLTVDLYYYMSLNKRIMKYRQKEAVLSREQIDKFKSGNVNELFIRKMDRKIFNEYLLQRLKKSSGDADLTASVRREKVKEQVKEVFRGIFSDREMTRTDTYHALESCKKVVGELIQATSSRPEIYHKIQQLTGGVQSTYDHASNVSVFTTLFALTLNLEKLDSAAIGGLLHDIGMALLPMQVDESRYDELGEREQNFLKEHPRNGIRILESRKFTADDDVKAILLQHHERFDGKGYPQQLKGEDIHPLARVCAIANAMDDLTSLPGLRNPLSAVQALEYLLHHNKTATDGTPFDHDMLMKLLKIFLTPSEATVSDDEIQKIVEGRVKPLPEREGSDRRARRVAPGMKY